MRKICILMALTAIAVGCGGGQHASRGAENHDTKVVYEEHDQEGQNHDAEDYEHDHGTHSHSQEPRSHQTSNAHEHHAGEIELSEEQQKEFGIETIVVEGRPFNEVLTVTGRIAPSPGDEISIAAPSSGIVTLASLSEGSTVAEGGVIATISGKGISGGDELEKAWETLQLAKREYERDAQLLEDNIISRSHYESSLFAYEQASREYRALAGNSDGCDVKAATPTKGYVKSLLVSSGDYVEAGQAVAVVSRNSRLQLKAMVPEKYYGLLPSVCGANFKTSYGEETYSVDELGGSLVSYGRTAGEGMMLPVIFEFNASEKLIPGSYAEVYLIVSPVSETISLPLEAVVEDQGLHYVFIQHEEDAFLKRQVTLGQSNGREVAIADGLIEGEQVVVKGAMQVKLAGAVSVPSGHNHQH